MRPGWPHLAHRLLVGTVPGWPRLWPRWPHQEWPGVAKLLKQLHLVAFRSIPCRCWFGVHPLGVNPTSSSPSPLKGDLCVTALGGRSSSHPPAGMLVGDTPTPPAVGHRPSALPHFEGLREPPLCVMQKIPSREKGFARIRGNDGCFRVNDACNQCKGLRRRWGNGQLSLVWRWVWGQGQGCAVPACAGTTDASRSLNSYHQLMPLARCRVRTYSIISVTCASETDGTGGMSPKNQ